jgi:tetratricopeptide (TPR) repeat protein
MRDQDYSKKLLLSKYHASGQALLERGWFDEALKELSKVIAINDEFVPVYENLASIYEAKGELISALKCYLRILDLDPDDASSFYNLALFLSDHANTIAIESYKKAISLDSEFPEAFYDLGICLMHNGEFEQASYAFLNSLKIEPNNADVRLNLADCYIELGQYVKAILELKKVILSDLSNIEAHLSLGMCYIYQGFYQEAERIFLTVINLDQNNALANFHIASIKLLQNNIDECLNFLKLSLQQDNKGIKRMLKHDIGFIKLKEHPKFTQMLSSL